MTRTTFYLLFTSFLFSFAGSAFAATVSYSGDWSFSDTNGNGFFETLTLSNPYGLGAGNVTSYSPNSDSALVNSFIAGTDVTGNPIPISLTLSESSFTSGVSYEFDPDLYKQGFSIYNTDSVGQLSQLLVADLTVNELLIGTDTSTPSGKKSTFGFSLSNIIAGADYFGGSAIIDAFLASAGGIASIMLSVGDDLSLVIEKSGSGQVLTTTYTGTATSVVPVPAALPLFLSALGILGLLGWGRHKS